MGEVVSGWKAVRVGWREKGGVDVVRVEAVKYLVREEVGEVIGGWVKTGTRLKIGYFIGALNRCKVGRWGEAMGKRGVWVETGIHVGWGWWWEMGQNGCVGGNWYTCGMEGRGDGKRKSG